MKRTACTVSVRFRFDIGIGIGIYDTGTLENQTFPTSELRELANVLLSTRVEWSVNVSNL